MTDIINGDALRARLIERSTTVDDGRGIVIERTWLEGDDIAALVLQLLGAVVPEDLEGVVTIFGRKSDITIDRGNPVYLTFTSRTGVLNQRKTAVPDQATDYRWQVLDDDYVVWSVAQQAWWASHGQCTTDLGMAAHFRGAAPVFEGPAVSIPLAAVGGRARAPEVIIAEALARVAHLGQTTKSEGMDYIEHPKAVAALVEPALQPAAWLHDVLEDTAMTIEHLRAAGISEATLATVLLLTRDPDEPYVDYIARLVRSGSEAAIRVKLADLHHNLRPGCPPALAERYRAAWLVLSTAVTLDTTPGGR